MKKIGLLIIFCILCAASVFSQDVMDLSAEYSRDEFQRGIRNFHNCRYESAITDFTKSLSFDDNNNLSRYFLGESYRKAGYEKNALFEWNSLLLKGNQDRNLKNKISLLYNKRGMIDDIFVNRRYLLREDIKGYYDDSSSALFIKPSQIAVDADNNYYIASFIDNKIVVLDSNLNLVRTITSLVSGVEQPFGIAVHSDGSIFVSDFKNNIIVNLDANGIVKKKIGYKGIGVGGLLGPKNILIDDENNIFVSDSGNKRINKYKSTGEILFSFGNKQNAEEKLSSPCGLLLHNNKIYVCDRDNDRIVIFDKNGNYSSTIGEGKLHKPTDIAVDVFGRILILCEKELWSYEEENNLWDMIDVLGKRLNKAVSIATDHDRNILISDFNTSRLLILSPDRLRYTNFNVNIERVFQSAFPNVHLAIKVENDDLSVPVGLNSSNFNVYENGKYVPIVGSLNTAKRDDINDIVVIYDCKNTMEKYKNDFATLFDEWFKSKKTNTNIAFFTIKGDTVVIENDFGDGRLSILETIKNMSFSTWTDKGFAIKDAIYYMISRFSKKSIILVTDGNETYNDYNKFKIDDAISLATNNDISLNIVSFRNGTMTEILQFMTKKSEGLYYDAYKRDDIKNMLSVIESKAGSELILSYKSNAISRFGDEPITVYLEVAYSGITGATQSVYFPPK